MGFEPGDRVVVYHIAGCGNCEECRKGFMIGCHSPGRSAYGWQRDGGHADFLLAEARTLLHLPEELTYADGALVACGFGTAYQGILRAGVSGRDRVLVVGLGPVGLGAVMLAARATAAPSTWRSPHSPRSCLTASIRCASLRCAPTTGSVLAKAVKVLLRSAGKSKPSR